jgi:hypothetical protein
MGPFYADLLDDVQTIFEAAASPLKVNAFRKQGPWIWGRSINSGAV